MEITMSQEIITVLEYICKKLGIVIDWTAANVWPQILEILSRYRILMFVKLGLGLTVLLFIIFILCKLWYNIIDAYIRTKSTKEDNFWWEYHKYYGSNFGYIGAQDGLIAVSAISLFVSMFLIAGVIVNARELIEWIILPELQFLELFNHIISQGW